MAGASLATLFGLPGIIGALGGAPNATKSVAEALSDLAINLGSLAVCAYFVRGDLQVGVAVSEYGSPFSTRARECACVDGIFFGIVVEGGGAAGPGSKAVDSNSSAWQHTICLHASQTQHSSCTLGSARHGGCDTSSPAPCCFAVQAREKQLARLMREDELGACQLELANGRVLRLAQLRCATLRAGPRPCAALHSSVAPMPRSWRCCRLD